MNEHLNKLKGVIVYFEAENMFKNKFGKLCIKPVMLKITKNMKDEYMKHQKILDLFEAQPILTFNEGKKHWLEKDKKKLLYLAVDFTQKEFKGNKYYPSEMFECNNKVNIELIRKNEVKSLIETRFETEVEIHPDEL